MRAPHCGQAYARAKFFIQTAALMGFYFGFSVIPLPPHQFRLLADEFVQDDAGLLLADRQRRRGLRHRHRVAALHVADDRLAALMNVNVLDADNLLPTFAALPVQRRQQLDERA